jgi:hypothetical protein
MAIKTKYNYKGIEIPNAVIKVNRLFGSKQEGWNSLVGVYNITTEEVPAIEAIEEVLSEDGTVVTEAVEAKEAYIKDVYNLLEEFNHSASYSSEERGYVSIYKSLAEKFGGIEI